LEISEKSERTAADEAETEENNINIFANQIEKEKNAANECFEKFKKAQIEEAQARARAYAAEAAQARADDEAAQAAQAAQTAQAAQADDEASDKARTEAAKAAEKVAKDAEKVAKYVAECKENYIKIKENTIKILEEALKAAEAEKAEAEKAEAEVKLVYQEFIIELVKSIQQLFEFIDKGISLEISLENETTVDNTELLKIINDIDIAVNYIKRVLDIASLIDKNNSLDENNSQELKTYIKQMTEQLNNIQTLNKNTIEKLNKNTIENYDEIYITMLFNPYIMSFSIIRDRMTRIQNIKI
jgi:pyruvate/2-oxoglutarate dehydrogenase complex dihydrolipoamide acyltransferase (E2) component